MEPLEHVVARLVERVEGRYFGKYRGIVSDVDDPRALGRVRVRVPHLTGDVELGWALPCLPYGGLPGEGLFTVPGKGAGVWVEFEGGNLAYPVWTGSWWATGEVPQDAGPAQKVLRSAKGHVVVLDDEEETLTVTDANGNSVTMDSAGVAIEDVGGNTVTMDAGGITIGGSTVAIGEQATDHLVGHAALNTALQALVQALATHTHTVNGPTGLTSPPVVPIVLGLDAAKSRHEVEL
ncbi:phage baseplate assembly protein V [Kitasatospora sp. NPDC050463]|uniref:phage baseplate assembly protein V n=1 Tax=Kitasatospora sp. NPDC050463 TaxID=3155786 RepID=UPI0033FD1940